MDLPKVEGTQVRGKIYHLNLRIKPEIQDLYGGKSHLRGSLRTSDPKVARREVRRRRAELMEKEQERARQAEVDDLVSQLTPEQRAAFDAAGGLEGLLEEFEHRRARTDTPEDRAPAMPEAADIPSFLERSMAATRTDRADPTVRGATQDDRGDALEDDRAGAAEDDWASAPKEDWAGAAGADMGGAPGGDWPAAAAPGPAAAPGDMDRALDTDRALTLVEEDLPDDHDPYGYDERVFTLADLLAERLPDLEPDTAEAMRLVVRLFTEFHGDVAYDELTMEHLDEFITAAHGLPADMMAKLADGTYVRDLPFAEMVAWTVHAGAKPISETTRFQYVAMLKNLMRLGVPQHRRGDPWSDYRLQIVRREIVEPPAKKPARRFTPPSEWTLSGALMRLLEIAIILLVAGLLYLLWQART